jgi:hypothetical protein
MLFCTFGTTVIAVPMALLERVENPNEQAMRFNSLGTKVARAAAKTAAPTIVFVDPSVCHANELKDEYLLAEEAGGVPYRGSRKVLMAYLNEKMAMIKAAEGEKAGFKRASKRLTISIKDVVALTEETDKEPMSPRLSAAAGRVGSMCKPMSRRMSLRLSKKGSSECATMGAAPATRMSYFVASQNERAEDQELGCKWINVGSTPPIDGEELTNARLSFALKRATTFSEQDFAAFHVGEVFARHYIRSGSSYFQPDTESHRKQDFNFVAKVNYQKIILPAHSSMPTPKGNTSDLQGVATRFRDRMLSMVGVPTSGASMYESGVSEGQAVAPATEIRTAASLEDPGAVSAAEPSEVSAAGPGASSATDPSESAARVHFV